ncbi:MAG: YkgJ family cysteine cluster protein, partial [Candidatus Xenobia bacterium]
MSDLLAALERLYQNLEAALPQSGGNPCGQCYECCTGAGLSRHRVSELELGYLRERVGPERVEDFRQYAERARGENGELRFAVCPYYDTETHRCGVYAFRPFSCRVFGHFRADTTHMPQRCVFRGRERVFEPRQYLDTVPLARELRQLMRAWEPTTGHAVRYVSPDAAAAQLPDALDLAFLDAADPVDRAITRQVKGDWEGARDELLLARQQYGELPHIMQHLGIALEMTGDHAAAREVFLGLLRRQPDNSVFHYHVGV